MNSNNKRLMLLSFLGLFILFACNLSDPVRVDVKSLAETSVAATIAAGEQSSSDSDTQTDSGESSETVPDATATVTPTSTSSITTITTVTVSVATNCRSGPLAIYDQLTTLGVTETAEVIGKHTPSGYWIVKIGNVECWLWGKYAIVQGPTDGLKEYDQPATPTPAPPSDWSGSWTVKLDALGSNVTMNTSQSGNSVSGSLPYDPATTMKFAGTVSGDGKRVEGTYSFDDGPPMGSFAWNWLGDGYQFNGNWLTIGDGGAFCGGREGQGLPGTCSAP